MKTRYDVWETLQKSDENWEYLTFIYFKSRWIKPKEHILRLLGHGVKSFADIASTTLENLSLRARFTNVDQAWTKFKYELLNKRLISV